MKWFVIFDMASRLVFFVSRASTQFKANIQYVVKTFDLSLTPNTYLGVLSTLQTWQMTSLLSPAERGLEI